MPLLNLTLQQAGSPHIFTLVDDDGIVIGNFRIRKAGGNQTLEISCVDKVTLEDIQTAWRVQGETWMEHYKVKDHPEGAYEALRAIVLESGQKIVWYLYHKDDAPADSLQQWGPDWSMEDIARFYGFTEEDYCGP